MRAMGLLFNEKAKMTMGARFMSSGLCTSEDHFCECACVCVCIAPIRRAIATHARLIVTALSLTCPSCIPHLLFVACYFTRAI